MSSDYLGQSAGFERLSLFLLGGAGLIQLFVLDLGAYLSRIFPDLAWTLQFRLLIISGIIGTLWLLLGNRKFGVFFGYIIAYPFVVVLWHLPRVLFHNWPVLIAFSPAIYSIIKTFRITFFMFNVGLISAFIIYFAENRILIIISMVLLGIYLIFHYAQRFRTAFSASTVFGEVAGLIRKVWDQLADFQLVTQPVNLEPESDEYKTKYAQSLLTMYMATTGLHYLGERAREVITSKKLDVYFLASLLYTFFLTAIVFSFEYVGLERVAPGSFVGIDNPTFLDFLGFSFSTLMTSDISSLKPVTNLAQIGTYLQLFGSLLIVVLLAFIILTSIRERYSQDLDKVVDEMGAASDRLGSRLEANYTLTLAETEIFLLKVNPDVMKWLLKLRHGEDEAKRITQLSEGDTTQEDHPQKAE